MKKRDILLSILVLICAFSLVGCNKKTTVNANEVVLSELVETISAELGERCDIPKLTAKLGKVSINVEVLVKNSKGEEVELQGRDTRFIASDINGYTINYTVRNGNDVFTRTVTVTVNDLKGPDIVLPKTAYSMNVKKDEEVTIPSATITDKSGNVKSTTVKVYFNGSEVKVKNNKFTADKYGEYKVLYEAEDLKGNKSSEEITIKCARMVVIEAFENANNVFSADAEFTTENAVSGNCMKVFTQGTESFKLIAIYPKYTDLISLILKKQQKTLFVIENI